MYVRKLIYALVPSLLVSCGGFTDNQGYDAQSIIAERDRVISEMQAIQEQYIEQNKELTAIMEELNELSGRTSSLELNIEGTEDPLSQAEQINESIELLKKKLDFLEQANAASTATEGVIHSLRTMVKKQENEILSLKSTIQQKNEELARKQNVIDTQRSELVERSQQLMASDRKRVEHLYQAGYELEKLADDDDNVLNLRGKKNKLNGISYKVSIYEKALLFYRMAAEEGHQQSIGRCSLLQSKIDGLQ